MRIMIVEEDSTLRLLLAIALATKNLEIVSAVDGIDALERYEEYGGKFDAILTDNEMPRMEGLEFVRSIREAGFCGRIVVMSGNMKRSKVVAFQEFDICAFFQKPFDVKLVAQALRPASESGTTNKEI
jgi:two-component system cell cycle sensor histidine kinase/response regulator CckA